MTVAAPLGRAWLAPARPFRPATGALHRATRMTHRMDSLSRSIPPYPNLGDVIDGRFVVEQVLGTGGMGVVVAARDTAMRRKVALKLLLPDAARQPASKARLLREARATSAITSEHVARVLDVGTLKNGAPYIVMELLAGTTLGALFRMRRDMPIEESIDYVLQACEAVAEAHALGIVHRDLKLSNLFVTSRDDGSPLVKVLDFGLSKVLDPHLQESRDKNLTASGMVMGSPFYMSPEQLRGLKFTDARTDVWSIGVILYRLITRKRPFLGDGITNVNAGVASEAPLPLRAHRADVPPALDEAVLRCLVKDVNERTQSIAQLVGEIAPFASPAGRASAERARRTLADLLAQQTSTSEALTMDAACHRAADSDWPTVRLGRARARIPRGLRAALWVAGGLAALGCAVALTFLRSRPAPAAPAEAAPARPTEPPRRESEGSPAPPSPRR